MPIHAICPECDAAYTLADQQQGKKVRCKQCDAVFVARDQAARRRPAEVEEVADVQVEVMDADDVAEVEVDEVEVEVVERPRPRRTPPARPTQTTTAPTPRKPVRYRGEDPEDEEEEEERPQRGRGKAAGGGSKMPLIVGLSAGALVLVIGGVIGAVVMFKGDSKDSAKDKDTQVAAATQPGQPVPPPGGTIHPPLPGGGQLPPGLGLDPGTKPDGGTQPVVNPTPPKTDPDPPKVNPDPPKTNPTPPPEVKDPPRERPSRREGGREWLSREAKDRVKRATVYIVVTMADGSKASGSGFFGCKEAKNIVLTNAHVVGMLDPESRRPRKVEIYINSGEANEVHREARVLGVDRSSDLAVLDLGVSDGMPEPLVVRPASDLTETDKVWVFGFPLGERLGKEITIRDSSVSSFRRKNGVLEKIQVNGGMDPGNSGGPVVDGAGDVIGVAVSGIPGRMINFCIPGDRVHTILNGRISNMVMGQTFEDPKGLGVPVTMEMIDPRNRIKSTALEVWLGNIPPARKPSRPPSSSKPAAQPGDSPHQRYELEYKQGAGSAEIILPALEPSKVYWVQPTWTDAEGKTHWAAATVYKPRNLPVKRVPASLVLRWPARASRPLRLEVLNSFRIGSDEDSEIAALKTEIQFNEQIKQAGSTGAMVQLQYQKATRQVIEDRVAHKSKLLESIEPFLRGMIVTVSTDGVGNQTNSVLNFNPAAVGRLPRGVNRFPDKEDFLGFHEPIKQALETMAIPLPNKEVTPQTFWRAQRPLPIPLPNRNALGRIDMSYTYLGQRNRNGRDEAVIAVEGDVKSAPGGGGKEIQFGGRATGTVLVDLSTGQVSQAEIRVVLDMDAAVSGIGIKGPSIRLLSTLHVRLFRKV